MEAILIQTRSDVGTESARVVTNERRDSVQLTDTVMIKPHWPLVSK